MAQVKERVIDGEKERLCTGCNEWWPADEEFFYRDGGRGLSSQCKACYLEKKYAKRKLQKSADVLSGP